jgi:hypothetical protein
MGARNFVGIPKRFYRSGSKLVSRRDGEPELEPIASGNLQSCTEKNFQCHESFCVS